MKRRLLISATTAVWLCCTCSMQAERPQPAHNLEAFRAWMKAHKHPPATVPAATDVQTLGGDLFRDKNLSLNRNQACATCHSFTPPKDPVSGRALPASGFVDPENVETGSAVSRGSVRGKFGVLNAPSAAYAAFSPQFHWNGQTAQYVGGQFWNGRAANLEEQAAQPFLNPLEMAMPSKWAVVTRLKENARYRRSFEALFDLDLDQIAAYERAPATAKPPPGVFAAYDAMTRAIATFEKIRSFNRFTSKFDFYLAGVTELTPVERHGLELFNFKALCSRCHVSEPTAATDGYVFPPLFTDFTYENIGVPRNTSIPGHPPPSLGLGGRKDVAAKSPAGNELGKHKIMTLRNVAVTAPYGHNGVFATLEEIVHFYNTRDVLGVVASDQDPGFGVRGWPRPEVPQNVNFEELGNLGLTPAEEAALVAFMKTLTDNYPAFGNDPNVPPGTPSPFANTPFPPFP